MYFQEVRVYIITLNVYADIHTESYLDDEGECTEREVHTLPHTRPTASPVDHDGGVETLEGPGSATKCVWPEEESCGLCITLCTCVCVCVCEKRYITVKSADLANSLVPRPSHRPVFDR